MFKFDLDAISPCKSWISPNYFQLFGRYPNNASPTYQNRRLCLPQSHYSASVMAAGEAKDAYLVFCSDARVQELIDTPWLKELESECHVRIQPTPGGFLIYRQSASVQVHQQCKHLLINLIKSGAVTKAAQWFWFNGHTFTLYDDESCAVIERNFQQGSMYLILEVRGKPYQIDITRWRQTDMTTRLWRPIARNPMPGAPQQQVAPQGWCIFDRNTWRKVPEELSDSLTSASQAGQSELQVTLHGRTYDVSLRRQELRDGQRTYKLEYFRQA